MAVCKYVEILVPLPVVSIFYCMSTGKGNARVEAEWLSCKNLQVSGRNLQGDASPCKFFFQKLASSYKLTLRLASSYKLTIRLTRLLQVNHLTYKLLTS